MTPPDLVDGYLQLTRQALTPSLELREGHDQSIFRPRSARFEFVVTLDHAPNE